MASDFETLRGFPSDYKSGHFALVGPTGSGKTYYAKYLAKNLVHGAERPVFVFVGAISAHDWTDPEPDGLHIVPSAHVYNEWNKNNRKEILEIVERTRHGFVIFDDFKGALNFHTDKHFKQMFRVMRHMGVQLLAVGHTPNDIPPVVKDNITHAILFFSNNRTAMTELATTYLGGDTRALRGAMRQLTENAVFKINVRHNTRHIHAAPPPEESGIMTSDVGLAGPTGVLPVGPQGGGVDIGTAAVSGRHVAVHGGTYNDASTNQQYVRIDQDIRAQVRQNQVTYQDMRMRAQISREIELDRVRHDMQISMLRKHDELKTLLLKPWFVGEERDRAAALLGEALGDTSVTAYNLFNGEKDVLFMRTYFPEIGYTPRQASMAAALTYSPVVAAIAAGNNGGLVQEGAKAFGSKALQMITRRAHPNKKRPSRASLRESSAARERVRLMISTRRDWRSLCANQRFIAALRETMNAPERVNDQTCVRYALKLLERFFPEDFARERRRLIS